MTTMMHQNVPRYRLTARSKRQIEKLPAGLRESAMRIADGHRGVKVYLNKQGHWEMSRQAMHSECSCPCCRERFIPSEMSGKVGEDMTEDSDRKAKARACLMKALYDLDGAPYLLEKTRGLAAFLKQMGEGKSITTPEIAEVIVDILQAERRRESAEAVSPDLG